MSSTRLNQIVKWVIVTLSIAIAYSVSATLCLVFAPLPGKVTAIWLPSGLTLAFFTWCGWLAFPGIALGSLIGVVPDFLKVEPPLSIPVFVFLNLVCVVANCLQPAAGVALIKRLTGTSPAFNQVQSVNGFIVAAVVSPMLSATIGITSTCSVQLTPWIDYGVAWLTWWLASMLAHLLFTPPLLLWRSNGRFCSRAQFCGMVLALGLSLVIGWVVFIQNYPIEYTFLPILIWSVFRCGGFFTSVLVCIISVIAIVMTSQGLGSFITNSTTGSLLLLQSFIAVCSITTLVLGAVIQERRAAELALERTLDSLEQQIEERTAELQESKATLDGFFAAAPVGLGIVDHQLRYVRINQLLSKMNGLSIERHLGQTIWQVLPNLAPNLEPVYQKVLMTGQPVLNQEESGKSPVQPEVKRTWLTSYFPITSTHHAPSKVGVIVMDISDRKKMELQLQLQARRDSLTAIPNRLHFQESAEAEWRRCSRIQKPLSLILLDIDEFKRYNDAYGHLAGDACLIQFANLLLTVVNRAGDVVARYGGEEFVVILPDTDAEGAVRIAQLIRQRLHQKRIPHPGSSVAAYVTASLGVAICLPNPSLQVNDLIQAADEGLYESKRQGRDRITLKVIGI
ncbi:diguanylate cyclase [Cyanobacteria bacterium FACHB-DQ100]|nr:diguanylate cyclase [Cyanobacteria bacterium FACHB-DQ100]